MDFIDWATTSQEWIRRGLVVAVTAVGGGAPTFENNSDQDQDDFVKMESPLSGAASAAETHANDYMMMGGYSTTAAAATPTAPFLSKTAEAELYLLATNFLLCKSLLSFLFGIGVR